METFIANTFINYGTAAVIIFLSFLVAGFCSRNLQKLIEKKELDSQPSGKGKRLNRFNSLLRLLIISQGFMIALNHVLPLPPVITLFLPDLDLDLAQYLIWTAAALFILLDGLLIVAIVSNPKKSMADPEPKVQSASSLTAEEIEAIEKNDPDFQIVLNIATLFLEIQKQHLGASEDSPSRFNLITTDDERGANYLFELEVHLYGNWKRRRLTIARLGADSGSRSKCFYVIFDEYLVVKVPPIAITDGVEYIDSIKVEAKIASQIDMAECIIPSVAVILKKVEPSIETAQNSLDSPETLAIKALRQRPDLYRYLQVGGTFAYFMDMSKYFFLQDAINMIHKAPDAGEAYHFLKSKSQIEGIVANLLDLLAFIGNKGVALRDLKPDNLLLAGDRNQYPLFLARPEEYKIGLIDIETAVVFGNPQRKYFEQPQLGGTPQYATPCHFFTNEQIRLLYGETADIMHLQDWQGIISVIFKVIDNSFLFIKSGRQIRAIATRINNLSAEDDVTSFAGEMSHQFWDCAEKEFREKLAEKREVLTELKIPIGDPTRAMFKKRLTAEKKALVRAIKKLIANQTLFPTEKNHLILLKASSKQLEKLALQKAEKAETVRFLRELKGLREQYERQVQVLKILDEPRPGISALLLLETMFSVVSNRMFLDQWRKVPSQDRKDHPESGDNTTAESEQEKKCMEYQTVIADQTIKA